MFRLLLPSSRRSFNNTKDENIKRFHSSYFFQFNSIQFNGYLLTRRLKSTSAYYKASTKAEIEHKNGTNTQKQNTN
jgi:hypothetical protein